MKTALIVVTLVEIALLVVVLAVYLIAIAGVLRRISSTLGLITFGVRAIEKQTQPIGPVLADVNGVLEQVAAALDNVSQPEPPGEQKPGVVDRVLGREPDGE